MSRFSKLMRLKEAVKDLLHEGLDVVTILKQTELFYDQLYEEASAAEFTVEEQVRRNDQEINKLKRRIAEYERQLSEREQLLAEREQELAEHRQHFEEREERFYKRGKELEENDSMSDELWKQFEKKYLKPFEEHRDQFLKHEQEFAEHKQEFADYQKQVEVLRRELASKQQMKLELEFLSQHQGMNQQNPNKFLIYDETLVNPLAIKNFWGGRFFVTIGDRDANSFTCSISVYDMFQGKTKSFTFEVAGRIRAIYALRDPYFLLYEFTAGSHCLHLAKLDFKNESWQIVQSHVFRNLDRILVNESDSSKFLLWRDNNVDVYRLVGDEIQLVKNSALGSRYSFGSYFGEKFCGLKFEAQRIQFNDWKLTQVKMSCYDLERSTPSIHNLDSTPEILDCHSVQFVDKVAWMRDTVFLPVRFKSLNKHGVIFTNPQMQKWKLVEFGVIDSTIHCIQSFNGEGLVVCAQKHKEGVLDERKVYRLHMRKPDLLRNMAWIATVKLFKEAGTEDPCEEARNYLPLTSEIQPFMLPDSSD